MKKPQTRLMQGLSSVLLVMIALGFGLARWFTSLPRFKAESYHAVGKLIHCDAGLNLPAHADVLAYGLEDPRGVVYDQANKRILIADGTRRKIVAYSIERRAFDEPENGNKSEYCPDGLCGAADLRGLAMFGRTLYVAEHDEGRIMEHAAKQGHDEEFESDLSEEKLTGPSGIVFDQDGSALVADDRPWPGPAGNPSNYDTSDYTRWVDSNKARVFGALYKIEKGKGSESQALDNNLPHPSGIALGLDGMSLYVATCDGRQTQWIVFTRKTATDRWNRRGILATETVSDGHIPRYQGIAVSESGQIFAAGPNGLYVFGSTGAILGRMEFHHRITGLTWASNAGGSSRSLYFAMGHALCRLNMS